jgi:hypothetical protein
MAARSLSPFSMRWASVSACSTKFMYVYPTDRACALLEAAPYTFVHMLAGVVACRCTWSPMRCRRTRSLRVPPPCIAYAVQHTYYCSSEGSRPDGARALANRHWKLRSRA